MHYVYVLESLSHPDTYYVGLTANLKIRLGQHNAGEMRHTAKFVPWKIKNYVAFNDEKKARDFERYLKSGSGRAFAKRRY